MSYKVENPLAEAEKSVVQVGDEFSRAMSAVCGGGLAGQKIPDNWYSKEMELKRGYMTTLFQHFGSDATDLNRVKHTLDRMPSEDAGYALAVLHSLSDLPGKKLPYAADDGTIPFSAFSSNLSAKVLKQRGRDFALVTTDKQKDGYHVCISHLPDAVLGSSPTNVITDLAVVITNELKPRNIWQIWDTPIHFYVHVPPELGTDGQELFRTVEMSYDDSSDTYENPVFTKLEYLPAGIDKAFLGHVPCPEPDRDRDFSDERAATYMYRECRLQEHEIGMG